MSIWDDIAEGAKDVAAGMANVAGAVVTGVSSAVGSVIGGPVGTVLGPAAGTTVDVVATTVSAICPIIPYIPGTATIAGTLLGGPAGTVLGGIGGFKSGSWLSQFFPYQNRKSLGQNLWDKFLGRGGDDELLAHPEKVKQLIDRLIQFRDVDVENARKNVRDAVISMKNTTSVSLSINVDMYDAYFDDIKKYTNRLIEYIEEKQKAIEEYSTAGFWQKAVGTAWTTAGSAVTSAVDIFESIGDGFTMTGGWFMAKVTGDNSWKDRAADAVRKDYSGNVENWFWSKKPADYSIYTRDSAANFVIKTHFRANNPLSKSPFFAYWAGKGNRAENVLKEGGTFDEANKKGIINGVFQAGGVVVGSVLPFTPATKIATTTNAAINELDDRAHRDYTLKVDPNATTPSTNPKPPTTGNGSHYIPPTNPKPTDPTPTDPNPTDPNPTDPSPTNPKPTDPTPTNPTPTDPKPTDPSPTNPKPTDPNPTGPLPRKDDDTTPSDTGASKSGYTSYNYNEETPTEIPTEIVDEDIIKEGNKYTIPTSSKINVQQPTTQKGNAVIPVLAGLSAAAAAGIGAKAYMDRKNNRDNEDEDEFKSEDWSTDSDINMEYQEPDNREETLDFDDSNDNYEYEEPEKYGAKTHQELEDLQ